MVNNKNELSKYRLEKALEDLKSAEVLFQNNLYKQSINRSYYSIFHATRAILALDMFDSKKHSGVIAYFNQNYIATSKFESKYSKILMGVQKIRNSSDYDDFYVVSKEEAEMQINNAKEFVVKIKQYIDDLGR